MWHGRVPYGKCDIVPGECYVATEFEHIAWLPVIPIRSWVILEGSLSSEDDLVESFILTWEGIPIPFSWKSFAMAWLRTILLLAALAGGIWLLFLLLFWLGGYRPYQEMAFALLGVGAALFAYWISLKVVYANAQRAEYLRQLLINKYGDQLFERPAHVNLDARN